MWSPETNTHSNSSSSSATVLDWTSYRLSGRMLWFQQHQIWTWRSRAPTLCVLRAVYRHSETLNLLLVLLAWPCENNASRTHQPWHCRPLSTGVGGRCSDTVLRYPTTTRRGSPARTLDCVWWQLKVSHTHAHADRTIFCYDSRKSKRDVLTSRFTKKCWPDLYPAKQTTNVSQLRDVRAGSPRRLSVKTPINRRRQRRAAATTVRRSADNADGCRVSAAWNEG